MLKAYLFNDYTTALAAVEYVNGHWRIENGPDNMIEFDATLIGYDPFKGIYFILHSPFTECLGKPGLV